MAKKNACKKCKMLFEGNKCPLCKSDSLSTSWQGRIFVSDVNKSMIADKVNIKIKGEYAIKVK
jgi:DNA-directed RNA polymerase subunit E"